MPFSNLPICYGHMDFVLHHIELCINGDEVKMDLIDLIKVINVHLGFSNSHLLDYKEF